jgi:tetratricopeptide (TPR) repeat protein
MAGAIDPTAKAQQTNLPPEIARTLYESKLEHDQAMQKRFEPIIQDLSKSSDSDYSDFYANAVHTVFFAQNNIDDQDGWKDWQKKNKGLLEDPRLPIATAAAALYLQGHLYSVLGKQSDAVACYNKILNIIANGPQNLAGFHLMQESLTGTLFFKYYNIPSEYLDTKNTYCGSMAQTEQMFKGLILPDAIQNDPKNIDSYWNTAIVAIGNVSSLSDAQRQKYAVDDYPRLVLEEAQCLVQLNQQKNAIFLLERLLSSYPDSPRYKDISDALIAASTSAAPVSIAPTPLPAPAPNLPPGH